jgi:PIN domain nuclease of toxin-antitoxin system
LLWAAYQPDKLSKPADQQLLEPENTLVYSSASIWEIGIKSKLGREDFQVDVTELLRGLRLNGYTELKITSDHAVAQMQLPDLHRDPFDRILLAQAIVEQMTLFTSDEKVLGYDGPITKA